MNPAPLSATPELEAQAYTVSFYVNQVDLTMAQWGSHIVKGEVSSSSGNSYKSVYFTLKDEQSTVDCIIYPSTRYRLSFLPEVGQKVVVIGRSSLLKGKSQFKILVSELYLAGRGMIMEQLKVLEEKLRREGVFDFHKRPLPPVIRTVGVITSEAGEVFHDICKTMNLRYPGTAIRLYPAQVQGAGAPASLMNALALANWENCCDVLIIGRGGGSFEDLLCFSDEALTRAVAQSQIPIISAVGHEPDFCLCDYAADVRASTPTQAAETVTPVTLVQRLQEIAYYQDHLDRAITQLTDRLADRIDRTQMRLENAGPLHKAELMRGRADTLCLRLDAALERAAAQKRAQYTSLCARLSCQDPEKQLLRKQELFKDKLQALDAAMERRLDGVRARFDSLLQRLDAAAPLYRLHEAEAAFAQLTGRLEALNPLARLKSGYSYTTDAKGQTLEIGKVKVGDTVTTRLSGGQIVSTVTAVLPD